MLQQTRVAAVVPYYRRFLQRFPTVRDLARARMDAVLRHWAGLGYYSRARNLHRAAKEIVARHGGEFPARAPDEALALPGIGRYTAAAVLSIAYGAPLRRARRQRRARPGAAGRDARRFARDAAASGAAARRAPRRRQLLARDAPGDWNQAMMELGATICTPRAPRCDACPVARWCRAHALGIALRLPSPRRKPKPVRLTLAAAVLLDPRGRTLLVRKKSGDSALFSNLWHFPSVQSPRRDSRVQSPHAIEVRRRRAGRLPARGIWHRRRTRTVTPGAPHRHLPRILLAPYPSART